MLKDFNEGLKRSIFEKTAKNTIESELEGERVLMKYGGLPGLKDWHRIYPPVIEVDNKLKWIPINLVFGGRRNFVRLLYIIGFILIAFYGVSNLFHQCTLLAKQVAAGNITAIVPLK